MTPTRPPTPAEIEACMGEAAHLRERVEDLGPDNAEYAIASALAVRDATIAGLRADLTAALTRADVAERERDEARAALAAEHGGYIGGNLS